MGQPLVAQGYRPDKNLAHYRTLLALPLSLGLGKKAGTDYLGHGLPKYYRKEELPALKKCGA